MAAGRRPGQPGRLAHGHAPSTGRSTSSAAGRHYARKLAEVGRDPGGRAAPHRDEPADPDDIDDDLLRLVFTACHPVLSAEARIALTLRLLGGLTTPEIARAFLVPEATVAQRIVRAKRTLATKSVALRGARTAPTARPGSAPSWRSST